MLFNALVLSSLYSFGCCNVPVQPVQPSGKSQALHFFHSTVTHDALYREITLTPVSNATGIAVSEEGGIGKTEPRFEDKSGRQGMSQKSHSEREMGEIHRDERRSMPAPSKENMSEGREADPQQMPSGGEDPPKRPSPPRF